MEELKAAAIRHGIKVPLTHNNAAWVFSPPQETHPFTEKPSNFFFSGKGHYSAGPGKVDIAAIDAYPV